MLRLFKRVWRYVAAALTGTFEQRADPRIQVEQAIGEARDQHRQLTERAATVIANQRKAEINLDRALQELSKLSNSAQQAVRMAEEARQKGQDTRANELTSTAEAFAGQLVAKEQAVDSLKQLVLQSAQASQQAKQAVNTNGLRLQEQLTQRQKLLSQLDQAKMQEQINAALASVSQGVGQDMPSLESVRDKIEQRYAQARGMSELQADSVEGRMLEVEQASLNTQAQQRLGEIRAQLGMPAEGAADASDRTAVTACARESES